jgi:DNA-binding MarR family transcriptional regulator
MSRSPAQGPPGSLSPADVAARLHSAAIHLLRRLRREDDATGLTAPRLSVLSVVVFAGPRTLGELAQAEQVRPPTMTRLVAALEAQGLVRRVPDPQDGRVTRIAPTSKGRDLLMRGRGRRVRVLARDLGRLTAVELRSIDGAVAILERLNSGAR